MNSVQCTVVYCKVFLNRCLQRATMEALAEQMEALLRMVQVASSVAVMVMVICASAAADRATVMQHVFRASNGIL